MSFLFFETLQEIRYVAGPVGRWLEEIVNCYPHLLTGENEAER